MMLTAEQGHGSDDHHDRDERRREHDDSTRRQAAEPSAYTEATAPVP
jgi:hypothetical protein